MPHAFISYRRADSADTVKLLHERLQKRLPLWSIFYDHLNIGLGDVLPEVLKVKVPSADVVFVVIGPAWLDILHRRQTDNVDHVREEIRLALGADLRVIPILVGHAPMPSASSLEAFPDLQPLLDRNGWRVRPDPDFDADVEALIAHLKWLSPEEGVGATLADRYTLTGEIGSGGMGVVFRAEQKQPVKRTVAVKLIKPGMDTREVLARFEAERQALAVMDHANIAKVLDAGTTSRGRPFFVMEYVRGVPITQYCDEAGFDLRARIELVIPICSAVQHAHQKGIIHRDLKPSNVLVDVTDGRPLPKVIDFGLAKAVGHRLTDKTLHTAIEAHVGTLEYSAPEQATGRSFDVDTRSDIYSLGVLLYELLTGAPPFSRTELLAAGEEEMRRMIRDVVPPRPSQRLSSGGGSPAPARGSVPPPGLARLVQGDLDWVVMRCLEKERDRRYRAASDVADELQRYLSNEPVLAGPPSATYRLRKFARRHRAGLTMAGLAAATVVAAVSVAFVRIGAALQNEREASGVAETRRVEAQAALASEKAAYEVLSKKQYELEGETARGWLLSLASQPTPLSTIEIDVIETVAHRRDGPLAVRFITEAACEPELLPRLGARSEVITHAAVGLDRARRTEVEEVLTTRLRQRDLSKSARRDLSVALARLGDLSPEAASLVADTVIRLMPECANPSELPPLSATLAGVADRLTPEDAARAAGIIVDSHVRPTRAALPADTAWDTSDLQRVAARLTPDERRRLAVRLAREIGQVDPAKYEQVFVLQRALAVISPTVEPRVLAELTAEIGEALLVSLSRCSTFHAMTSLAQALTPVLGHMSEEARGRIAGRAARAMAQALKTTKNVADPVYLKEGMAAVSDFLTRGDAGDVAAEIVEIMRKDPSHHSLEQTASALPKLLRRADPVRAAQLADDCAAIVVGRIGATTNQYINEELTSALSHATPWLSAARARKTADTFARQILQVKGGNSDYPWALRDAFRTVARQLDAEGAEAVAPQLAAYLNEGNNPAVLSDVLYALVTVAERSSPPQAEKLTELFLKAMGRVNNPDLILRSSEGLTAALCRTEPTAAAEKLSEVAVTYRSRPLHLSHLAAVTCKVSDRLSPADRGRLAEPLAGALVELIKNEQEPGFLYRTQAADRLAALLPLLPRTSAEKFAGRVVTILVSRFEAAKSLGFDLDTAAACGKVLPWVSAEETGRSVRVACAVLTRLMEKTTNAVELERAARVLTSLAKHLDPPDAARVVSGAASRLTGVLAQATAELEIAGLSESLAALAPVIDPDDAVAAVATMSGAIDRVTDRSHLEHLVKAIVPLAARLHPTAHAPQLRNCADALVRVLAGNRQKNSLGGFDIATSLAVVATKLPPVEAAGLLADSLMLCEGFTALPLSRTLETLPDRAEDAERLATAILPYLFRALARKPANDYRYIAVAVEGTLLVTERARRAGAVASSFGIAANGQSVLATLPALIPVTIPFPSRLSAQHLVDLLKHPLCVGSPRRAVLDALEGRYGRKFADLWEFVAFAEKDHPELNLLTPPKRPEKK